MKRKAEERLRPFLDNGISSEDLKKMVKDLSPSDLGELRSLIWFKIREMEAELDELKTRLEQAECSKRIMDERMSFGQSHIHEARRRWHVFNNIFEERKKQKQALKTAL